MMNVLFIGFGSIAKRHIKNLYEILDGKVNIDLMRRESTMPSDFEIPINNVYSSYNKLPEQYDAIFITNPTKMHYETLQKVHNKSNNFFIEKPVFETGEEDLVDLDLQSDKIYYVACPLRYTNVIQYLKKNIAFKDVYSMRCISSSYLPDWRPGIDYRNTYSARKELGGGVSIDLIHEWDYICYLLGQPNSVKKLISKKSNLEINSDDIAVYIADYDDIIVELHLDYFGRVPQRKIELFMKEDVIEADLINQKIVYKKDNRVVDLSQERNEYQKRELKYFLDVINGNVSNDNSILNACDTLRLARAKR